jgi:hypothetical protein
MTFDELWRLDAALKRAFTDSVDQAEEVKRSDDPTAIDSVLEDPDREEINRFLEWLEESLQSGIPNEHLTE